MFFISRFRLVILTMAFFTCGLFFASSLLAKQYEEGVSSQEYLFVKGMVRSVSLTDQSLTIQQKKGPNITVLITPETELEGFYKLEDLELRKTIKAWYRPEENGNRALKIEKPLETGC